MSKQHHYTVWWDTSTRRWEIGHARYEEDEPLFDTETEEWATLHGEDARNDDRILGDLQARLDTDTGA